ncbi:hypothetical protein [Bilophila wadsworthia]|uniref:hypothetical protein n=1 Tax=Bilophila wadsworthia TaxID=35833 RepID=UPI003AB84CA8
MLTEKERKWLENRSNKCLRCLYYSGVESIEGICFWCSDKKEFVPKEYGIEPLYRAAAEFEARVAARLAGAWAIGEDMCFNNHCQLFAKDRCTACYLKNARIAVEEEMDNE